MKRRQAEEARAKGHQRAELVNGARTGRRARSRSAARPRKRGASSSRRDVSVAKQSSAPALAAAVRAAAERFARGLGHRARRVDDGDLAPGELARDAREHVARAAGSACSRARACRSRVAARTAARGSGARRAAAISSSVQPSSASGTSSGHASAVELRVRVARGDRRRVRARAHRAERADHADRGPFGSRRARSRAGLDRADHRHRARRAQRRQRVRRGRVARDQHELHAAVEQEPLAGQRVLLDGARALACRKARAPCRRGRRCPRRAALDEAPARR